MCSYSPPIYCGGFSPPVYGGGCDHYMETRHLADFLHLMWNIGKLLVMSRWNQLSSAQATTTISDHPSALWLLIQVLQAKTMCQSASCKCKHMVCNKQVKLGEDDWVARKWQQFLGTISYPRTNYHCQDNSQLTATVKPTTGFQLTTVEPKQESSLQTVH